MRSSRTPVAGWRRAIATVAAALAVGGAAACVPPSDAAPARIDPDTSRAQLDAIAVKRAGSMRGYSRERFPHWAAAGSNCDVRDVVLRRDGQDVRERGCNVVGGRWYSQFDGRTVAEPGQVDVDHMVPLANAWRSGAARWTKSRREQFANDLDHPQLIAVSRTSNRAKGDQDPAQWKPPNRDYWCRYAQDWIAVKHYYRLSVTPAEKTALTKMLETCRWPGRGTSGPPTSSRPPAV